MSKTTIVVSKHEIEGVSLELNWWILSMEYHILQAINSSRGFESPELPKCYMQTF